MKRRAMEGTFLDEVVLWASQLCQQAEQACPRTGPGRPPEIPDWVLGVMITVGVLLRKKTKSAQYVWWRRHLDDFARWMPSTRLPARSTFYERYRRVHRLMQAAIGEAGQQAVAKGWADARCVAADKSLISGRGRKWSAAQRRRGHVPHGVDSDTTWGYSKHDRWVQGYAYEAVVSAPKKGVCWPLLASVDTASRSEKASLREKLSRLPSSTRHVLADAGYDGNALAEAVEWLDPRHRTGRRFLCPEIKRPQVGKSRAKGSHESRGRQYHRRLRDARRKYLRSPCGQRLYARRKTCVEWFNSHFKQLFELEHHVWHRRIDNNRTQLLAAIFAYQLLLGHQHRRGNRKAQLQCLLDAL